MPPSISFVLLAVTLPLPAEAAVQMFPNQRSDPQPAAIPPEPPPERWYGLQILAVDLPADVLFLARPEGALGGFSGSVVFLGSPIIHLAHGSPRKALGSLGLTLVGSLVAALALVVSTREPSAGIGLIPYFLPVAAAQALDLAFLAYEPTPLRR